MQYLPHWILKASVNKCKFYLENNQEIKDHLSEPAMI